MCRGPQYKVLRPIHTVRDLVLETALFSQGDMSGDAARSHRIVETLRALQSQFATGTDITEELALDYWLDVLSHLQILQQTILQQMQRAHVRRNLRRNHFGGEGAPAA